MKRGRHRNKIGRILLGNMSLAWVAGAQQGLRDVLPEGLIEDGPSARSGVVGAAESLHDGVVIGAADTKRDG